MVVGADAVGGPPHRDVTDEGGAECSARWSPYRLSSVMQGVVSDVLGECGDQLGSLGKVVAPVGMSMEGIGASG